MKITVQDGRRRSKSKQNHRRKPNIETTKIEGKGDDRQEVAVHCEPALQRKQKSTFSWFEEFTVEWSETFIHKRYRKHRKGE